MKAWVCVLAVAVALAGCGDSDNDGKAESPAASTPTPSLSTPSSAPAAYVENETCRTKMRPLVDIMLANNQDTLDYSTFDNRVDQLTRAIDAAVAPCSPKVNGPARKTMYRFTLARVQWSTCGRNDDACIEKVTDNIRDGLKTARNVDYQIDLTS